MITFPEHSFVRDFYEGVTIPCTDIEIPCLPVNEITDIKFQVDTDIDKELTLIITNPVNFGTSSDGGKLVINPTPAITGVQAGDTITLSGLKISGVAAYVGTFTVIGYVGVSTLIKLDTTFTNFADAVSAENQVTIVYENNHHFLFAFPCSLQQGCSDSEVASAAFDILFSDTAPMDSWDSYDGRLRVTFSDADYFVNQNQIVEGKSYLFLGGNDTEIQGFFKILTVDSVSFPGLHVFTLDSQSSSSGAVGSIGIASLINNAGILALEAVETDMGSAWTFNTQVGTLYPEGVNGFCFKLCIVQFDVNYKAFIEEEFTEDWFPECVGSTNCFVITDDLCFTTKIQYGNDDDSLGFFADGNSFQNSVRLPMKLSMPQYPGSEKGYQFGTGQFKKLSERRNKTWLLKTDMIGIWHERLAIALSSDNIQVTNELADLVDEDIYKSDEYKIEWDEREQFDLARVFAPGSVTVFKQLFTKSTNSNCV